MQQSKRGSLIELDPKYADVIVRRWQDFTGEAAVLEGSGEAFEEVRSERLGDPQLLRRKPVSPDQA